MGPQKIIMILTVAGPRYSIGYKNKIPWDIPAERSYFRHHTNNQYVIVGRRTWDSWASNDIGTSERKNIVVSRSLYPLTTPPEHAQIVQSYEDALNLIPHDQNVYVIGGEQIFETAMMYGPRAVDEILLGVINGRVYHQSDAHADVALQSLYTEYHLDAVDNERCQDIKSRSWLNVFFKRYKKNKSSAIQ